VTKTQKILRSPLLITSVITGLVFLTIILTRALGALEFLELTAYDWTLRLQAPLSKPDSRVVLVTISEKDLETLGQWPLSDKMLAVLLEKLAQAQPRVIGLDIYRNFRVPPGTEQLEVVLKKYPEIIGVMKYPGKPGQGIPAPPILQGTNRIGINDVLPDAGGTIRRSLLFINDGEQTFMSFGLILALKYLESEGIQPVPDPENPEFIKIGPTTFWRFRSHDGGYVGADDRGYQMLLTYHHSHTPFTSFSLDAIMKGAFPSKALSGKVVLVGLTAESVKDYFYTPYSLELGSDQQISGIALHGHVVSQILRGALQGEKPIQTWDERWEWGWILLWCMVGGFLGFRVRAVGRFSLLVAGGGIALSLGAYWGLGMGWWIPVVPPLLGLVSTQEQRKLIMDLFSRHVSTQIAEQIWKDRDQFIQDGKLRPHKYIITVLFADLENFTGIAENLSPQELMAWLNRYMEFLADTIMEFGGVVDDYFGDGIKADFGVPLVRTKEEEIQYDAESAVVCAWAISERLKKVNEVLEKEGYPTTRVRMGIYTGPVVAGSLGSVRRLKYTTIGDVVNIAARLESLPKEELAGNHNPDDCRILIGQATKEYLGSTWETEEVGKVKLKGKDTTIKVYRVVGITRDGPN
jgi:adenylate cyclase